MTWRALFVDDEKSVLQALRLSLHRYRQELKVETAQSGPEAIERIQHDAPDVLITDLRMPGMDGVELLQRVRDARPDVARLVLTGQAKESVFRKLPELAHHVLHKPCPPEHLFGVIARVCEARDTLPDDRIRDLVGGVGTLPTPPDVYQRLDDVLQAGNVSSRSIAAILESEPGLAAKVLHVANSGFFGLTRHVTSLVDAVGLLGTQALRNLVLSTVVLDVLDEGEGLSGLRLKELRKHDLLTARLARAIVEGSLKERAFITGLVHNVGFMPLAARAPDTMAGLLGEAGDRRSLDAVARDRLGFGMTDVGAYLLGIWGFDQDLVEGVAYIVSPATEEPPSKHLPGALYLAAQVAATAHPLRWEGQAVRLLPKNLDYTERFGDLTRFGDETVAVLNELDSGAETLTEPDSDMRQYQEQSDDPHGGEVAGTLEPEAAQPSPDTAQSSGAEGAGKVAEASMAEDPYPEVPLAHVHEVGEKEGKPRVLCVDDEPAVIDALRRNLARDFDMVGVTSGEAALEEVAENGPFAVIISDMRMPGMSGADLLTRVRKRSPDTTRMLLTGHADIEAAMAAVNEGQIFRFLVKPTAYTVLRRALDAAVEQHRLVTSERVLLEETVRGSVQTLVDTLALANPVAFGRGNRITRYVRALAREIEPHRRWQVEVAAMVSQIGAVTLPTEVVDKLDRAEPLGADERSLVRGLPGQAAALISPIPRLEEVVRILREVASHAAPGKYGPPVNRLSAGARIVMIASDYDLRESQGEDPARILAAFRGEEDRYRLDLIDHMEQVVGEAESAGRIVEMNLEDARAGMVFEEEVYHPNGSLFFPRGFTVTRATEDLIANMAGALLKLTVQVRVGA